MLPGKIHLKFFVRGEIGERRIDGIRDQDKIDRFICVASANSQKEA